MFSPTYIINGCPSYVEFRLIKFLYPTYSGKNQIKSQLTKGVLADLRMQACILCAAPKGDGLEVTRKLKEKVSITT